MPDDAARILEGLNNGQRRAVLASSGPVAILAGAGTGKTRVISHRVAFAIATGVVAPADVLVVTFTDKAATEMVGRLRSLGLPAVTARTFHAHALAQLGHFWPSRNQGRPLPEVLPSKIPLMARLARALPGGYRFTPAKDLADEIEWAKARRIGPMGYVTEAAGRMPPVPHELFARVYADYERAKARVGRLDFDDMLTLSIDLLESDEQARETVQRRKRWFCVDEYQDTNPLQQRLLELWLGDRRDLCVVGDEDQTIYTFTGATSDFLTGFQQRWPGARVLALNENYRSTPEVLAFANRLIGGAGRSKRLTATPPSGPPPTMGGHPDEAAELAAIVEGVGRLTADGVPASEIAVLTRTNAQLAPIEEAFTEAQIGYQVRGGRFFDRREVRDAINLARHARLDAAGGSLAEAVLELWASELGYGVESGAGREARERDAALDTLLAILGQLLKQDPSVGGEAFLAELDRRAAAERQGAVGGVELLTYHRAKGLEWDAVFLPTLEEGSLPIRQAFDSHEALAEERRLLYVGITRARRYLALSWADRRTNPQGREVTQRPSRFLRDLGAPDGAARARPSADGRRPGARAPGSRSGSPLSEALRAWRSERARADAMPAYVIAHDATIEAIAEARPGSIAALRRVRGMGPQKLEKYGPEILAVVAAAR